jgi:hypothetical protein
MVSTDKDESKSEEAVKFSLKHGRILQTEALKLVGALKLDPTLLAARSMIDLFTVDVGTGTGKQRFPVHEAIARRSSKLFGNALKPEWAAARPDPRVVDLSDESPEIFYIYLHWL